MAPLRYAQFFRAEHLHALPKRAKAERLTGSDYVHIV